MDGRELETRERLNVIKLKVEVVAVDPSENTINLIFSMNTAVSGASVFLRVVEGNIEGALSSHITHNSLTPRRHRNRPRDLHFARSGCGVAPLKPPSHRERGLHLSLHDAQHISLDAGTRAYRYG